MTITTRKLLIASLVLLAISIGLVFFGSKGLIKEYNDSSRSSFIEQLLVSIEAGPLAFSRLHAAEIAQKHLDRLIEDMNKRFDLIYEARIFSLGTDEYEYAKWQSKANISDCIESFEKKYSFDEALSTYVVSVKIDMCKPSSDIEKMVNQIQGTLILIFAFMIIGFSLLIHPILISLKRGNHILGSTEEVPSVQIKKMIPFLPIRNMINLAIKTKTLEKDIAKVELTRQVAHDIRSPVGALRIAADNLKEVDAKVKSLILKSVDRINNIADDLLEKSKNHHIPELIFDLQQSVSQIVEEKNNQFPEYSIVLRNLSPSIKLSSNIINESDIQRITSNLINNSIEARSPERKLEIIVQIETSPEFFKISIQDNGKGIPESVLPHLGTQNFSYGKDSGFGLGLSYAQEILLKSNSKLEFKSELNRQTTVNILLRKS